MTDVDVQDPAVKPDDGYRTIKLLELARQSSLEGRTLPIAF